MPDITQVVCGSAANPNVERKQRRFDYVAIILLFALALGIRLYLYRFHDVISVDGTGYVGAARKLLSGDISGLSFYGFYPVLIWLASLAVPDMEVAAQLVSVVMGSLLVVPLYLLGLKLFSRVTAAAACIVTVVWSSHLFVSCIVANQATYTTLALTAMYLVWRMFEGRESFHGYWAGFVMGLAFLTRPEAFLLFIVMPLAPLFGKRREFNLLWRPVAAYGAVFFVILFLNLLLVHHFTGTWQLAAKTSSALNDTVSYYLKIPDMNQIPGVASIGYLDFIVRYPDLFFTNPINNIRIILKTILPAFLWLLVLVGIFVGVWRREKPCERLFLLCSFAPLAVIVVFYYISDGYVEPFLPVLFLWCAEGGRRVEQCATGLLPVRIRQIIGRFTRHTPAVLAASFMYAIVLLVPQIPGKRDLSTYTWRDDDGRRDHKRIGLMLKQYLPPGKIMTRWGRLAYYSGHEMVGIPNTDLPGIEQAALEGNARFLVLYGGNNGVGGLQLDYLLDPLFKSPKVYLSITPGAENRVASLHKYLVYNNPGSCGVIVYELIRQSPKVNTGIE